MTHTTTSSLPFTEGGLDELWQALGGALAAVTEVWNMLCDVFGEETIRAHVAARSSE